MHVQKAKLVIFSWIFIRSRVACQLSLCKGMVRFVWGDCAQAWWVPHHHTSLRHHYNTSTEATTSTFGNRVYWRSKWVGGLSPVLPRTQGSSPHSRQAGVTASTRQDSGPCLTLAQDVGTPWTWAHLGTFASALSLSNGTKFGFTAPTKQID